MVQFVLAKILYHEFQARIVLELISWDNHHKYKLKGFVESFTQCSVFPYSQLWYPVDRKTIN